jgi:diguanylate cyclase (GGDEF)-like protein
MVLALLVLHVLLGALCLVVARGPRGSRPLRLWGLGLLCYAIGLLTTIASWLPVALSKVLGNALIAYAPVLTIEGVLSHTRYRLRRPWVGAGLLATIVPIVLNHLGDSYVVLVDLAMPVPLACALFATGTLLLLKDPPAEARSGARFLAAILLASAVLWLVRIAAVWQSLGRSNDRDRADLTVALFAIAQMVSVVAATLALFWIEVRRMGAALERIAYTDALTGVPNRRAVLARFQEELARAARRRQQLALVLFDVDHFKKINDGYGHLAGDAALQHVARQLNAARRGEDVLGRLGGEEFVLLLTDSSGDQPREAAERLRGQVAASPLSHAGRSFGVTLSGGVAVYPGDGRDWDQLFSVADQRLYAAKQAGRNRVVGPSLAVASAAANP